MLLPVSRASIDMISWTKRTEVGTHLKFNAATMIHVQIGQRPA